MHESATLQHRVKCRRPAEGTFPVDVSEHCCVAVIAIDLYQPGVHPRLERCAWFLC
jgi:hypothetical protein